jgi:hypothetical protein
MPRGQKGKSMLGGSATGSGAGGGQSVAVSGFLQNLNLDTQTQGNVKNVEDLQAIIGIFNVAVANIAAAKKTLTS